MGWSRAFVETLDGPSKDTAYYLRFFNRSKLYNLSDGQEIGLFGDLRLSDVDISITSAAITPVRWSVNLGGFTINISGDARPILNEGLRRGAMAELFMVRQGTKNRVCIGQLRNISGVRGNWTLEFVDIITSLQTRLTSNYQQVKFFYNAGKTTRTTASFNFSSDTRLYLSDVTIFEQETGQNGMIKVEDATHSAIDYWLWDTKTITSGTAGYLNIVSTGNYPSEGSHDHLHSGDEVTSVVRIRGRADYILARLIMSTGDGTQGVFDDYPESWSHGIAYNPTLFNLGELNEYYKYNIKSSVSQEHEFQFIIEEPSSFGEILDGFLTVGIWPVWNQNTLAIRACQDPRTAKFAAVIDHITDRDIISIDSHNLYAPSQSSLYANTKIRYYDGPTSSIRVDTFFGFSIVTYPIEEEIVRDVTSIYRPSVARYMSAKDIDRLRPWDGRPYEELTITVTEKHAVLTAGDIVEISSNYIYGVRESASNTYSHKRAMVLSVVWSPTRSSCSLTLAVMT